jgi:RHS repeat-associated protein
VFPVSSCRVEEYGASKTQLRNCGPGTVDAVEVEVGGTPVAGAGAIRRYAYDGAGNVTQMGFNRYAYDGLNRLVAFADYAGGGSRGLTDLEEFAYDRWGNLTNVRRASSSKSLSDYLSFDMADSAPADGVPDNNRLTTVTAGSSKLAANLSWDDRGNLTGQSAVGPLRHKVFAWYDDDLLRSSTDDPTGTPTVWKYAYDAAGERVVKWHDGGSGLEATVYVRDDDGSVVSEWEYLAGGSAFDVKREYVSLGGMTVAEIDHSSILDSMQYVVSDHLGSTRVLFDEIPSIIESMDYYPFGEILTGDPTPETNHLFTGHERDLGTGSSGLDYMHARYYSPVLARFLSVDPVLGRPGSSQSWNRYSYVLNGPIGLVDPNGENPAAVAVGVGIGVGIVVTAVYVDNHLRAPAAGDSSMTNQQVIARSITDMAGALTKPMITPAESATIVVQPLSGYNANAAPDLSQVVTGPLVAPPPISGTIENTDNRTTGRFCHGAETGPQANRLYRRAGRRLDQRATKATARRDHGARVFYGRDSRRRRNDQGTLPKGQREERQ